MHSKPTKMGGMPSTALQSGGVRTDGSTRCGKTRPMSAPSLKYPEDCRCIIERARTGEANMARDEALLVTASETGGVALRFYRWRPPTLSVGYFQRWQDFAGPDKRQVPVVRRPSGGGAIWHDDEITYSMTGPFGAGPFPRRAADIFEKLHLCICRGLGVLGVEAGLSDAPTGASPLICFSVPRKYDIVAGGRKLLGSAQRRKGGAFLQHGSLPLSANRYAPGAVSLGELLAAPTEEEAVISALRAGFEEGLGLSFGDGVLTAGEEELARRLEREKYGTSEWTRRR